MNFSGTGSSDPDGTIVSYTWNFGDGSGQTGGVSAQRTYGTAGTYTATLTVTDNTGLTGTKAVTIDARPQATTSRIYVADIAMSLRTFKNGQADALATVTVRDSNGNLIPGATVNGNWNGVVGGSASGLTGTTGAAAIRSPRVKAAAGSVFTFTVTGVSLSGYTYDAALNVETSASITR